METKRPPSELEQYIERVLLKRGITREKKKNEILNIISGVALDFAEYIQKEDFYWYRDTDYKRKLFSKFVRENIDKEIKKDRKNDKNNKGENSKNKKAS